MTITITTSYGAELVFCTPTPTGRKETADKIAAETGGVIVHPYDNEDVIAGQVGGCHLWALGFVTFVNIFTFGGIIVQCSP